MTLKLGEVFIRYFEYVKKMKNFDYQIPEFNESQIRDINYALLLTLNHLMEDDDRNTMSAEEIEKKITEYVDENDDKMLRENTVCHEEEEAEKSVS